MEDLFLLMGSVHDGGEGMVDCVMGMCGGSIMMDQDVNTTGMRGKAVSFKEPTSWDLFLLASPTL